VLCTKTTTRKIGLETFNGLEVKGGGKIGACDREPGLHMGFHLKGEKGRPVQTTRVVVRGRRCRTKPTKRNQGTIRPGGAGQRGGGEEEEAVPKRKQKRR